MGQLQNCCSQDQKEYKTNDLQAILIRKEQKQRLERQPINRMLAPTRSSKSVNATSYKKHRKSKSVL